MGAFGFPFGDIQIPYGKTSRYIHIAHQCGKYIRVFAASAFPCLNNSIDIYGSTSACVDLFGYGIGRRRFSFDMSIIKSELPQRDNIHVALFDIVFYNKTVLYALQLFLFFILSPYFKSVVSYLKV